MVNLKIFGFGLWVRRNKVFEYISVDSGETVCEHLVCQMITRKNYGRLIDNENNLKLHPYMYDCISKLQIGFLSLSGWFTIAVFNFFQKKCPPLR